MAGSIANRLYGEKGMRELDRRALAQPEAAGGQLMDRAAAALLQALGQHFPDARRLGVLCGPGNNGGDGFVLARLAMQAGWNVVVHAGATGPRPGSDGERARSDWTASGGAIQALEAFTPDTADVWVDCLFGIGLARPIGEPFAFLIERLNRSGLPVLAADVPSGIAVDTGRVLGTAVNARVTVTMLADKLGLHTGAGVDHAGEVRVADLGIPEDLHRGVPFLAERTSPGAVPSLLPARRRGMHKGDCGHVLVVGGAPGTSGAARLAATAALRAGAGRVTLVTHPEHAGWANLGRPELMVQPATSGAELVPLLERADVVAIGPGLGQGAWGRALWLAAADWDGPLVVDADALNLLSQAPRRRDRWVLTPHPGEASRLLGEDSAAINADRLGAVRALVKRFGGVALLKGAGTLVASAHDAPAACVTGGHPGMATAGMGDVLTGIIAALLGQGLAPQEAAVAGGAWHVAAARLAATRLGAERGMVAGDVIEALPSAGEGRT
jgi:ADP-dependent NAD(P)H-hydrate dehydratase / NAD(P)H-hydrate epimerase